MTRDDALRGICCKGNSGFRWYFVGSVTSDFGTWLQNTAQVLLAYQLAHSVLAVGLVTFAQFTSPLLLGPWAGVAADKFGGRRTLLGTQVISAVVAATLAGLDFGGLLNVWILVIGRDHQRARLHVRAARTERHRAATGPTPTSSSPPIAMDSVSYNLGRAVAPLLTMAIGLAGVSFAWAFAANAASFVAFSVILWRIRMRAAAEPERRSRVRDGFLIARQDRPHHDPAADGGRGHRRGRPDPGARSSARQAAARVARLVWLVHRGTRRRHRPRLVPPVEASAHAPAGGYRAGRAGPVHDAVRVLTHAPTMWIAVLAALGAGASCLIANSVTRAVLAERAGPEKSAAVMAVWAIAWAGSKPVASLLDGALGSWIGPQWTGLILATPALVPITVIVLLPMACDSRASAAVIPEHSPGGRRRLTRRIRPGTCENLWPLAPPLVFCRQTSHQPSKRVDDNIARDRHNRGMADPTPTKS